MLTPNRILCLKERIELFRLVPPNFKGFRECIKSVNTYPYGKDILIKTLLVSIDGVLDGINLPRF